eukprot:10986836-Lingulodinium_polyedra.AAC.1
MERGPLPEGARPSEGQGRLLRLRVRAREVEAPKAELPSSEDRPRALSGPGGRLATRTQGGPSGSSYCAAGAAEGPFARGRRRPGGAAQAPLARVWV